MESCTPAVPGDREDVVTGGATDWAAPAQGVSVMCLAALCLDGAPSHAHLSLGDGASTVTLSGRSSFPRTPEPGGRRLHDHPVRTELLPTLEEHRARTRWLQPPSCTHPPLGTCDVQHCPLGLGDPSFVLCSAQCSPSPIPCVSSAELPLTVSVTAASRSLCKPQDSASTVVNHVSSQNLHHWV
ncbi:hypothetical protein P7K49_026089, partial [Saguinus oedipus]